MASATPSGGRSHPLELVDLSRGIWLPLLEPKRPIDVQERGGIGGATAGIKGE